MSAIVGARDKALRATIPRNINPTAGKSLLLDVDPPAFHQNAAGIPTTPSAKFTATPLGFAGTVMWSITSGGKLTGSTPNERTLLFSDMTADSVKVTVTIVYQGEAYIRVKTFFKLTDGAKGEDGQGADPADLSPEALAAALEGRITESQLYADLRSRINLIDSPASVIGSVAARVQAETDARVTAVGSALQTASNAIGQEVADRIAAILAESGARATYVQNYTFSKEEINSSLSIQATQIAAAFTYTDTKTGGILATAAADVRTYSYSKADTTSAISAAETRLRSEFVASGGATEAYVQDWSYSKAQSDSAEAAQTATITTSYQGYADLKKSEAKADAAADVRNYAYSKSDANAAEAAQSATLTTNYTAYADAARANAISTANADVRAYSYAKSATDSAITAAIQQLRSEFVGSGGATEGYVTNYAYSKSQIDQAEAAQTTTIRTEYRQYAGEIGDQVLAANYADVRQYAYSKSNVDSSQAALASTLRAEFTSTNGVTTAYLENYAYSKAQTNSAITQQTSTLVSTVGQNTTAIQQQFTTLDGLSGQLVWKIDNNNHVTGFGLASTPINGVPYSTMIFNVDVLAVALPGATTSKPIFTVGQVNGQSQAVFRTDLMVDGGLTARMLKIGGSDNIIPDPKFYDLGWWGRVGAPVGDYTGMNNGWLGGAIMVIQMGSGVRTSTSKAFASTPGATMRLEVQVELSSNYVGNFSIFFYVEGGSLYSMGCPQVGTWTNGDYPGWPIQFNSQSAKGRFSFSQEITIPLNSQCANAHMVIIDDTVAGNVAIGSCSATRVVDSTLIGPGVVETKHMIIAKGGAIYSGQTGFDQGEGFWLEGALPGSHGARFSLGDSLGRKIRCDPANGIMELVNMDDLKPKFTATITNSTNQSYWSIPRAGGYVGSYNVATVNGKSPIKTTWVIGGSTSIAQAQITTGVTGSQVQVSASAVAGVTGEFDFPLMVTTVDDGGRTATDTFNIVVNFT